MNADSGGSDIFDQYRTISNKLKKRFLRKPNVTEAYESFASLGQQCESNDLPSYAGLCWIAAARCEGSLSNIAGETACLLRSARQFVTAEERDFQLGSTTASENLQAALNCYTHSSTRFPPLNPLPIGIQLEIVEFLKRIDRPEYIDTFLIDAIQLSAERSETNIHCMELLGEHFIRCGDYVAALEAFLEIRRLIERLEVNGDRSDVLLKCEINAILLLLILRPNRQKLSPDLDKLLEKYTWGDRNDTTLKACRMTESMYLTIQSLVILCQSLDRANLIDLEGEFWPMLTKEQKELLRIVVKIYCP